jgi:hypothetical protein
VTASAPPPGVRELFDRYRDGFDRLDGHAVADLYAAPSGIVSGSAYVHWPDRDAVRANMAALCERYRSHGYRAARYEIAWSAALGADAAVADVVWHIERTDGLDPWRFHTAYNLVRTPAGWRIVLCTAYEEQRLPAAPR